LQTQQSVLILKPVAPGKNRILVKNIFGRVSKKKKIYHKDQGIFHGYEKINYKNIFSREKGNIQIKIGKYHLNYFL